MRLDLIETRMIGKCFAELLQHNPDWPPPSLASAIASAVLPVLKLQSSRKVQSNWGRPEIRMSSPVSMQEGESAKVGRTGC